MKKLTTVDELHADIMSGLGHTEAQIRGMTANQMEDLMAVQYNRGLLSATLQIKAEIDRVFKEFLGIQPPEEEPKAAENVQ